MKLITITSAAVLSCAISASAADTCTPAPSCSELGYTQSTSSCKGGKYVKCPFDTTKVACISVEPLVGDLKYSLVSYDHDGWLLCDGREFKTSQYPKLKNLIGTNFCHKYTSRTDSNYSSSNCTSGYYAIPDYRGFFLKGAWINKPVSGRPGAYKFSDSSTSSYYSNALNYKGSNTGHASINIPEYERLPKITGKVGLQGPEYSYSGDTSGAFSISAKGDNYGKGHSKGANSVYINFDASQSNIIYDGSHVVPANYQAYIFIYAGPSN